MGHVSQRARFLVFVAIRAHAPRRPAEQLGPGLATFIEEVSGSFGAETGSVVFTDEPTEVEVALTSELPEQAFGACSASTSERVEGERISWDEEHDAWFTLRGEPCPIK